jgi:hypothetical protein
MLMRQRGSLGCIGDIANIISPLVENSAPIRTPVKKGKFGQAAAKLHPSLPVNPTLTRADGSISVTLQPKDQPATSEEVQVPPIEIIISHKYPENYFIHHPDFLLPMTSLVGALGCRRKPLVQSLLKSGAQ